MIKKVVFNIIIILIIATLVASGLYVYNTFFVSKDASNQQHAKMQKIITSITLDKDDAACTVLTKETIKTALGSAIKTLDGPYVLNLVGGKGILQSTSLVTKACVFPFVSGATSTNNYHLENGLTVVVGKYSNDSGPADLVAAIRSNPLSIQEITKDHPEIGDTVFYSDNTITTGPSAAYNYKLQVLSGTLLLEFTIRQPIDASSFTTKSAENSLILLAQSVK